MLIANTYANTVLPLTNKNGAAVKTDSGIEQVVVETTVASDPLQYAAIEV